VERLAGFYKAFIFFLLEGYKADDLSRKLRKNRAGWVKKYGIAIPLLGFFVLRLCFGLLFHGFQFIQERLIADLEDLGGLTPVPACLRHDAFNGLAFRLHGSSAANFQQ
jgi:hypothetical protein